MSYYEDLTVCDYFGQADDHLLAIGWLDQAHSYRRGRVSKKFFERFCGLVAKAWQPIAVAGIHRCEFCVFTGGPRSITGGEVTVGIGATNVFVPAIAAVYVAPAMILHYVDAHEYFPPEAFQEAVMDCPSMGSIEYLRAIHAHGIGFLQRYTDRVT